MAEALGVIDGLLGEYQECVVGDRSRIYNTAFVNYLELENLLTVAKAVVLGAIHRRESRGCHRREDYPTRDDQNCPQHTLITRKGSDYRVASRPVTITNYPPAARSY
jgi:succinate dehydrogenase / fumarate reductase flavoprotein subunit